MNNHDVLAFAVAREVVRRVRFGKEPWAHVLSSKAYVTASRSWPVPDFVIFDDHTKLTLGAEFKPPLQTKREYLTGLGQAIAYARDFNYGLLIVPTIADDGYPIADHIRSVLAQTSMREVPVGLIAYDPGALSPAQADFDEIHFFQKRLDIPARPARLDQSFYAKWREISPEEMLRLLDHSYEEMRHPSALPGAIRERAFLRLWDDIQAGKLHHWAGAVRHYSNTPNNRIAVWKNYRNFFDHVGWVDAAGGLTSGGLRALHVGSLYGPLSRLFLDEIAKAILIEGKHLILFNAISEYQNSVPTFSTEEDWLDGLEVHLEDKGLLKRNEMRAAAAIKKSERQFLKAEKQLWKRLELIIARGASGGRVFHPGRGFVINWARITDLLQSGPSIN